MDLGLTFDQHDVTVFGRMEASTQKAELILAMTFMVLGFVPVVGTALDVVDFISSIASGNGLGALVTFVPALGEAKAGLRLIADGADDLIKRFPDLSNYTDLLPDLRRINSSLDEFLYSIRQTPEFALEAAGTSYSKGRDWDNILYFANKAPGGKPVGREWQFAESEFKRSRLAEKFKPYLTWTRGRNNQAPKLFIGDFREGVSYPHRQVTNWQFRERNYQFSDVELARDYPMGVDFDMDSFPIFDPYVIKMKHPTTSEEVTLSVEIDFMYGSRADATAAEKKLADMGLNPGFIENDPTTWLSNKLHGVWHHLQDGETMQLVIEEVHKKVGHIGGDDLTKYFRGKK